MEHHTNDLSRWPAFQHVDPVFFASVERFFSFDDKIVWVWTTDDQCYLLHDTIISNLVFGVSDHSPNSTDLVYQVKKVNELCGQGVVLMAAGTDHMMALTTDGRLFGWGNNCKGQVGVFVKGQLEVRVPVVVKTDVRLVRCGKNITAVLDTRGKVWCWGDFRHQLTQPIQLKDQVIDFQCDLDFIIALTVSGECYVLTAISWKEYREPVRFVVPDNQLIFGLSAYAFFTTTDHRVYQLSSISRLSLEEFLLPVSIESTISMPGFPVWRTRKGQFLLAKSNGYTEFLVSSISSLTDLCAAYDLDQLYTTPGLTTITALARSRLGDNFYKLYTSIVNQNWFLSENLFEKTRFTSKLANQLIGIASADYGFWEHTIFSYVHYLVRGTFVDEAELAWSLFTLGYLVKDVQLIERMANLIARDIVHYLTNHADQLAIHLARSIIEAFNEDAFDYLVTSPMRKLIYCTHLDPNPQACLIRRILQHGFRVLKYELSCYTDVKFANWLFQFNELQGKYIDEEFFEGEREEQFRNNISF